MTLNSDFHAPGDTAKREPFDPESLVFEVALAMFAQEDTRESALAVWDAYSDEDRVGMLEMARTAIRTFSAAIARIGVRLLPPNTMPRPSSVEEAAMMAAAAKQFMDGQSRKKGLIGSVAPKLILPGQVH